MRKHRYPTRQKVAETYKDRQGRQRFKGGDAMKRSQPLALKINRSAESILSSLLGWSLAVPRVYPARFAGEILRCRKKLLKEKPCIPKARATTPV